MGLKFRRGSTAQQSGSLAFGEPYVNTTLGTLVVGGATGDIVLSSGGTGSTGNFGPISGSGLDITGNANIAGNLTLGGAITIGDATADTVNVVASLSSSLIPQTTNAFDLGSATKIWRDLYISTGSIKFVEGTSVVKSLSAATLTALEAATGSANVSVAALNSFSSSQLTQNTALATISGSLILTASANTISVANLNSFSSSQLTQNTALATISGSLILTASANTISVANLNAASSSYETKGRGIVSGSSQITYASISSIPAGIVSGAAQVTPLLPTGVVSGSSQVVGSSITTNTVTVGSTAIALGGSATTIAGLSSVTSTGFTGALTGNASTATTLATARTINGTSFDGSANITIANLVSGSSQITLSSTTGYGSVINQNVLTTSSPTFAGLTINGAITATGDITAYYTSDKRHKNTIQTISNAVLKVKQLNGVTWEWNDDVNEVTKSTPKTGLIAQEVQQVLPQVVIERPDGFLALDYSKMVGLLVEAIKEQQIQIDQLKAQIGSK